VISLIQPAVEKSNKHDHKELVSCVRDKWTLREYDICDQNVVDV